MWTENNKRENKGFSIPAISNLSVPQPPQQTFSSPSVGLDKRCWNQHPEQNNCCHNRKGRRVEEKGGERTGRNYGKIS